MKVLNMAGAEVGIVELNDEIFGITPNPVAVHEVVKNHLANCRQGTQSALTRAEVSGGGRKPWRQKGTGHARQGSTRAPQWTHGGIVFAPKPRDYSYVLNKKVKRLALKSVLSAKAAEGKLVVIDSIKMDAIKTKEHLRKSIPYIFNERKTDGLCFSNAGVTPEQILDTFFLTKQLRPTHGTREGYHFKFSFSKIPNKCHNIFRFCSYLYHKFDLKFFLKNYNHAKQP